MNLAPGIEHVSERDGHPEFGASAAHLERQPLGRQRFYEGFSVVQF